MTKLTHAALVDELQRVVSVAGGRFGIALIHPQSGSRVLVNGLETFPAASTFKIGLAAHTLFLVDRGELGMDQMIELQPNDRVPYGAIQDHLIHTGVALSLYNWLELMLKLSDNTATDVLLRVIGGPQVLTSWVDRHVGPGFSVTRSTCEETRFIFRLPPSTGSDASLPAEIEAKTAADPKAFDDARVMTPEERRGKHGFTATPMILADLLFKVWRENLLQESTAKIMRAIMERCDPPRGGLKGKLPAHTVVARKTGLDYGSVNEVGVISLPSNRGELIVAILSSEQTCPNSVSDEAIADVARAAFDYFAMKLAD